MKQVRMIFTALLLMAFAVALVGRSESLAVVPAELKASFGVQNATPSYPTGITFDLAYTADEDVDRAELFYSIGGGETVNLITADTTPGPTGVVSYPLDLQTYYLPPGVEITYYWRLTGKDGAEAETDPATVTWLDTRFDWKTIQSDSVSVSTYDGNDQFAQKILETAQQAADKIQADLGVPLPLPVHIWAYSSTKDFSGTQAPNAEQWIAGVAYQPFRLILAVLPTGDTNEVNRVVPHEMAHQIVYQSIKNPYSGLPTWLDEGLAVYYQIGGKAQFPELVQTASDQGLLYSVRSLNSGFPYDSGGATLAYAESFSIVTFIQQHWGEEALANLINAYKAGVTNDEAAMSALGVDLDGLDKLWKESLGYQGDKGPAGTIVPPQSNSSSTWGDLLASGVLIWAFIALAGMFLAIRTWSRRTKYQDHEDDSEIVERTNFISTGSM
jgi:hypothetical protein